MSRPPRRRVAPPTQATTEVSPLSNGHPPPGSGCPPAMHPPHERRPAEEANTPPLVHQLSTRAKQRAPPTWGQPTPEAPHPRSSNSGGSSMGAMYAVVVLSKKPAGAPMLTSTRHTPASPASSPDTSARRGTPHGPTRDHLIGSGRVLGGRRVDDANRAT